MNQHSNWQSSVCLYFSTVLMYSVGVMVLGVILMGFIVEVKLDS